MGRVFERVGEGHQFNMHYLDSMLPLQLALSSPSPPSPSPPRGFLQRALSVFKWMKTAKEVLWAPRNKGGVGGSGFTGAQQTNEFMESLLALGHDGDETSDEREGVEISYLGTHGEPLGAREKEVLFRDMSPVTMRRLRGEFEAGRGLGFTNGDGYEGKGNGVGNGASKVIGRTEEDVGFGSVNGDGEGKEKMKIKVKDLSRLWLYVNGGSPKLDEVDVGIARMATI